MPWKNHHGVCNAVRQYLHPYLVTLKENEVVVQGRQSVTANRKEDVSVETAGSPAASGPQRPRLAGLCNPVKSVFHSSGSSAIRTSANGRIIFQSFHQ